MNWRGINIFKCFILNVKSLCIFHYFANFPSQYFSLKRYCLRYEYLGIEEPNYSFA